MKTLLKEMIKTMALRCGYRISKASSIFFDDPFKDMAKLCRGIPEPVIFDVGAHKGETSKVLRKAFPRAVIHSFEPFPDSYAALKENLKDDPKIKTFNYGLSNQNNQATFHANAGPYTNSLLKTDKLAKVVWESDITETVQEVTCDFKTLDAHMESHSIPKLHVLKLDVQGAEHLVLEGARDSIAKGKIEMIYTEIILQPTYEQQLRFDQFLEKMFSHGFSLHNIYNLNHTKKGLLRQIDALFTRNTVL